MKIEKLLFLLVMILFADQYSSAQEYKHCGSTEAEKSIREKYPELISEMNRNEEILNHADNAAVKKTRTDKTIIPIVFHIIHNYGPENISDAQIYDEVRILNEDYQKRNADTSDVVPAFDTLIANCNYEFRLATKDPEGNCTNGIDRIASYKTYGADDQSKLNIWNPTYYLNVWVVNTIGKSGVAGYAYLPSTANSLYYYDGIIILHDYIGSIGTGTPYTSRALTHEIGHYLNLQHTWGPTNNPNISCGDDNVVDTPPTKGHVTCSLNDKFCTPGVVENVQNYMEYAYCSCMFTKGQKTRMDNTLAQSIAQRNSLVSPTGYYWTGVLNPKPDCSPIADFTVNRQFTCIGNNILFKNQSYNDTIANVNWNFPSDATPVTSTSAITQSVSFANIGWKNISLNVTSNAGSASSTKTGYIYAADPVGKVVTNQINSFEDPSENNQWPIFNYANNYFKWEFFDQGNPYSGLKSLRYKGFDDRPSPANKTLSARADWDEIITTAYDLSGLTAGNAYVDFYLAGTTRGSTILDLDDTMFVYYSKDCGANWTLLKSFQNATLFNNGSYSLTNYIPNASTIWKPIAIPIPAAALTSSTFFKFRYEPGDYSNNTYLDNFSISSYPTFVNDKNEKDLKFDIVPNPATDHSLIQLVTTQNGVAQIQITNVVGAKVANMQKTVQAGILNSFDIPSNVFSTKGVYLVSIEMNHNKTTKKVVIE